MDHRVLCSGKPIWVCSDMGCTQYPMVHKLSIIFLIQMAVWLVTAISLLTPRVSRIEIQQPFGGCVVILWSLRISTTIKMGKSPKALITRGFWVDFGGSRLSSLLEPHGSAKSYVLYGQPVYLFGLLPVAQMDPDCGKDPGLLREKIEQCDLNPCWLMIIGDYTTQYIGDYNNPMIEGVWTLPIWCFPK